VALARAFLGDSQILVLDEPTSALDPRQIRQTRSLIRELARDKAVLVSSHILPEVEKTCDRVVIMARGAVNADARPAALLAAARSQAPYVVELAGAAERSEGMLKGVPGVKRVERVTAADGWGTFRVYGGSADLREAIAKAAVAGGVVVRELRRETPGLERLFLDLIEAEEGAAA